MRRGDHHRPYRPHWLRLSLAPLLLLAAACQGAGDGAGAADSGAPPTRSEAQAPAGGGLEIRDARAHFTGGTGAVYLTVVNGAEADRLLAVETPVAARAEAHETVEEEGVMRMVAHPEGFAVPAGATLELAPGGKHIMLVEPGPVPEPGGTFPLTLHFESAGAVEVTVPVTDAAAMGHGSMHHGDGDHGPMDHDMEGMGPGMESSAAGDGGGGGS